MIDAFAEASTREFLSEAALTTALPDNLIERFDSIDEVFREARRRNNRVVRSDKSTEAQRALFQGINYGLSVALQIIRGLPVKDATVFIDLAWKMEGL